MAMRSDGPPRDTGDTGDAGHERAEMIFGGWLADADAGRRVEFSELLDRHPQHADALRRLHAEWSSLGSLRGRLAGDVSAWAGLEPDHDGPTSDQGTQESVDAALLRLGERKAAAERYRVQREVGRGGMGVVLRVRDLDLGRDLALKRLRSSHGTSASSSGAALARFLQEAQVTAQLDHPAIVPVHELGRDADGEVFFTMKLVEGQDLAKVFARVHAGDPQWSRTRVLGILQRVCEAMAYAHAKGVVHRDLKPANVMVGDFGAVYVMDWGLAALRRLEGDEVSASRQLSTVRSIHGGEAPYATLEGAVVGTPAYMAPEQARGASDAIGPAVDVYAVGAMLYHLLGGTAPFLDGMGDGEGDAGKWGRARLIDRIANGTPTPLARLAPDISGELLAICERAIAPVAAQRYADMTELAEDLRALLEGRVVRAYRTGAWAELSKWVARNRALAAALVGGVGLALVGLGSAAWIQARASATLALANEDLRAARDAALVSEELASLRAQQAESVAEVMAGMFDAARPEVAQGDEPTVRELLDHGRDRIEAREDLPPLVRARLLFVLGDGYRTLGRYQEAGALLASALKTYEAEAGPLAETTLRVALAQAVNLRLLDPTAGIAALESLVERCAQGLAQDHETALVARAALGRAWSDAGRFAEAIVLFEDVLPRAAAALGESDQTVISTRGDLAHALAVTGRLEEAEAVHTMAVAAAERGLGPDAPTTITLLANLGVFYESLDRDVEALAIAEDVLERQQRVFGPDHPTTANTVSTLSVLRIQQGQVEARLEEDLLGAIVVLEKALGPAHLHALTARNNLANYYFRIGRFEDAEVLLEEAIRTLDALEEETPLLWVLLSNQGNLALERGETDRAEELFLRSYDGRLALHGPDHPSSLEPLEALVKLYLSLGRFEDASSLATELVQRTLSDSWRRPAREALLEQARAGAR